MPLNFLPHSPIFQGRDFLFWNSKHPYERPVWFLNSSWVYIFIWIYFKMRSNLTETYLFPYFVRSSVFFPTFNCEDWKSALTEVQTYRRTMFAIFVHRNWFIVLALFLSYCLPKFYSLILLSPISLSRTAYTKKYEKFSYTLKNVTLRFLKSADFNIIIIPSLFFDA